MRTTEPSKLWPNILRDLQKEFGKPMEAGPFQIWYGETRPREGKGHGAHGVRHRRIAELYGEWLRKYHAYFEAQGRQCQKAIPVAICDLEAYRSGVLGAVIPLRGGLGMLLPSQIWHASQAEALAIMEATAAHECTHLFNLYERPHGTRDNEAWGWFDEATASYFESRLVMASQDWLRYAAIHQFQPEYPVYSDGNHGCALVHRLVQTFDEGFLHRLWTNSAGCTSRPEGYETALEAIAHWCTQAGQSFVSPGPEARDLYTDFCVDAYFAGTHGGDDPLHALGRRFGQRALRRSWHLGSVGGGCVGEVLPALGCHHYRLAVEPSFSRVTIRVRQYAGPESSLKAFVSLAASDTEGLMSTERELGPRKALELDPSGQCLAGEFIVTEPEQSHLVLTVINCSHQHLGQRSGFDLEIQVQAR